MNRKYQRDLLDGHYRDLLKRASTDEWHDVRLQRTDLLVFLEIEGRSNRVAANYLSRIDASRYPVHPYWIGFLNPRLPQSEWPLASDHDPRFWPFSSIPGLQGSFNLFFSGPYRTFWCRPCTGEYFYYHGNDVWDPSRWTLSEVVAYLRDAVSHAEHPDHWRPLQQQNLVRAAKAQGIQLPAGAGTGEA